MARYTDHYSLICSLKGLPSANQRRATLTRWILKKPGGWDRYESATDDIADKLELIVECEDDIKGTVSPKKIFGLHVRFLTLIHV